MLQDTTRANIDAGGDLVPAVTALTPAMRRAKAWLTKQLKRGETEEFSETAKITPEIATLLLERNDGNRHIRAGRINAYAADISNGDWDLNAETIKVSRCGKLNDGQHRLLAVIKAQTPIESLVAFGFDRKTRGTIDGGGARTAGDSLGFEGIPNGHAVAALALLVMRYDQDAVYARPSFTKKEISKWYWANESAQQAIAGSRRAQNILRGPQRIFAAAYFIFGRIDEEQAKKFFETLGEKNGATGPRDSVLQLRKYLIDAGAGIRPLTSEQMLAAFINAWNMRRFPKRAGVILPMPDQEFPKAI